MSDEQLPKTEELPADDDTLNHDLARLRQSLRARSDDRGRQLLGTADRVYTAQVRATKATLPEAQVLGLVQALTYSSEMHILTVQDCHDYLERLTVALEPAARLARTTERLENTLAAWQSNVTRVDETLARVGEIPDRITHATTQAIREASAGLPEAPRPSPVDRLGPDSLGGCVLVLLVEGQQPSGRRNQASERPFEQATGPTTPRPDAVKSLRSRATPTARMKRGEGEGHAMTGPLRKPRHDTARCTHG